MIRSGMAGKTGIVRLKGDALTALRLACFERDNYRCTDCGRPTTWGLGHMAHIVGRGRGGSDTLSNVTTKCAVCHLEREHNQKSVPSKR